MATLREQLDYQMNLKNDALDLCERLKKQRDELLDVLRKTPCQCAIVGYLHCNRCTTLDLFAKAEGKVKP